MATFGIDVSRWQKGFDFAKAKKEGVEFAIIKASQNDFVDSQFNSHYRNAKAAGILVGAYHYLVATTVDGATKEAKTFINALHGKQLEYPVFVDVEEDSQKKLGKTALTGVVEAFCEALEVAGYVCGFYTNYDFYRNYMNGAKLAKKYPLWLASWTKECPVECQMWQFGGETNLIRSNEVAGVVCDQNYCYVDYPSSIYNKKATKLKSNVTIAEEVIAGKWGNGTERKTKLTAAGYVYNHIQWVAEQMLAGKQFDPKTGKIIAAAKPASATLRVGDKVKLASNATYYDGSAIPPWVKNSTLYLRSLNGDRAVISTVKSGAVTGAVNKMYLTKM